MTKRGWGDGASDRKSVAYHENITQTEGWRRPNIRHDAKTTNRQKLYTITSTLWLPVDTLQVAIGFVRISKLCFADSPQFLAQISVCRLTIYSHQLIQGNTGSYHSIIRYTQLLYLEQHTKTMNSIKATNKKLRCRKHFARQLYTHIVSSNGITLKATQQESPAIADKPARCFCKHRAVYLRTVRLPHVISDSTARVMRIADEYCGVLQLLNFWRNIFV